MSIETEQVLNKNSKVLSIGKEQALNVFHRAAKTIPAYKDYLAAHNINPAEIETIQNFDKIPPIDKNTYIHKYPSLMLSPDSKLPALGHASSGSSGQPTFWFRGMKQDEIGAEIYGDIINQIFEVRSEQATLVIICFSMGIWIAGIYTLMAFREITRRGYNLTTFCPGIVIEDICAILKDVAPSYQKVIIVGYPSFLTLLFDDIHKNGIPVPENLYILTSGDKFSEDWRTNMSAHMKQTDDKKDARIINIYGSADAGILGHETPLSIFIRQHAYQNNDLCKAIFGVENSSALPGLVQYDPKYIFFEEVNGELLFTTHLDVPLVRYNIHDMGKVISFKEMEQILNKYQMKNLLANFKEWELPFVTIEGRTDVAINFDAVKIYPENIQAGIADAKISSFLSGSFLAYTIKPDNNKYQEFHLELELSAGATIPSVLEVTIQECMVGHLKKLNAEYRKHNSTLGDVTRPVIHLLPHGDDKFKKPTRGKNQNSLVLSIVGKKPRVIKK